MRGDHQGVTKEAAVSIDPALRTSGRPFPARRMEFDRPPARGPVCAWSRRDASGVTFRGVPVVGVTRPSACGLDRQELVRSLFEGQRLGLSNDPDNPHDRFAVRVLTGDGLDIGFIAAEFALVVYYFLQCSREVDCRVATLVGGTVEKPNRGVRLDIFLDCIAEDPADRSARPDFNLPGLDSLADYYFVLDGLLRPLEEPRPALAPAPREGEAPEDHDAAREDGDWPRHDLPPGAGPAEWDRLLCPPAWRDARNSGRSSNRACASMTGAR